MEKLNSPVFKPAVFGVIRPKEVSDIVSRIRSASQASKPSQENGAGGASIPPAPNPRR